MLVVKVSLLSSVTLTGHLKTYWYYINRNDCDFKKHIAIYYDTMSFKMFFPLTMFPPNKEHVFFKAFVSLII